MQPKEFLYFLLDESGQSFSLDENDIVVSTPSPVPLYNSPDGWQEKMVGIMRNDTYFGMFRDFTIPLRFVNDGARIIRDRVYTQSIEVICTLAIAKLNTETYVHELWYKGELDYSKMNDQDDFFEVNVAEGGIPKILKAMEDETVEIPIGNDSETLILDGINLRQSTTSSVTGHVGVPLYAFGSHLPQTDVINSEGTNVGTSVTSTEYRNAASNDGSNNAQIFNSNNPNFTATTATVLIVKPDFTFKTGFYQDRSPGDPLRRVASPGLTVKVDLRVYEGDGTLKQALNIYSSTQIGLFDITPFGQKTLATHHIQGDYTLNLLEDDVAYLFVYGTPYIPSGPFAGIDFVTFWYFDIDDLTFQPGNINFGFDIKYKPSNVRCYRPDTLFQKLVEKIFGAGYTCSSSVLAPVTVGNAQRSLLIMSGDAVRNINGAVIKTTFTDFFKSMHVQKDIAMGNIGNNIFIEKRSEVIVGVTIADLGEVKEVKKTCAADMTYSAIHIGYPDQNYEDVNGRNEFNTTAKFTTPITRVVKVMDLVSPYRGDGYGIEFARVNLDGKVTTDGSSDNDIFILDAIGTPDNEGHTIWRPFRQAFVTVSGILAASSVYNISISPKRLLGVHSANIHSYLFGLENKSLVYQTSDKNPNLVTTALDNSVVSEKADVPVYQLSAGYYKPFYFNFSTMVPLNFLQLVSLSKSGVFKFSYKDGTFTGSLMEGSIKPATMEEQAFKLLSSATNDLTKLIH